jgi:hypothetical protein
MLICTRQLKEEKEKETPAKMQQPNGSPKGLTL